MRSFADPDCAGVDELSFPRLLVAVADKNSDPLPASVFNGEDKGPNGDCFFYWHVPAQEDQQDV